MGKVRSFLAGVAAGAAALFFSKKENRELVVDKAKEVKEKVEDEAAILSESPRAHARGIMLEQAALGHCLLDPVVLCISL